MEKVERFDQADRKEAAITYLPKAYSSFELNFKSIQTELATAPVERSGIGSGQRIDLPFPDGSTQSFVTVSSPVMEAQLAAKYPAIQSYKAWTKDKNT